ncbi:MAG: GNAT family N-acetyltransferase [Deltaproteobacteria bacterium]|nr:GNAT family N-acetyltransferase [Deltaproteobacteria bacterium]
MKATLRPAVPQDIEWLDKFYESQMRPYVELTHDWDPQKFGECFEVDHTSIIQIGGKDIGMLKVENRKEYIFLCDIQIKDEFKNQGIGSTLIKEVLVKADDLGLPVRLKVLKGNPVMKLYKRFHFRVTIEHQNFYEMERAANKAVERNAE